MFERIVFEDIGLVEIKVYFSGGNISSLTMKGENAGKVSFSAQSSVRWKTLDSIELILILEFEGKSYMWAEACSVYIKDFDEHELTIVDLRQIGQR